MNFLAKRVLCFARIFLFNFCIPPAPPGLSNLLRPTISSTRRYARALLVRVIQTFDLRKISLLGHGVDGRGTERSRPSLLRGGVHGRRCERLGTLLQNRRFGQGVCAVSKLDSACVIRGSRLPSNIYPRIKSYRHVNKHYLRVGLTGKVASLRSLSLINIAHHFCLVLGACANGHSWSALWKLPALSIACWGAGEAPQMTTS